METDQNSLKFERHLPASPETAFYVVSTAQGWRDWLCDSARFEGHTGGSFQLAWNSGWYAAGSVQELEPSAGVKLAWRGKDDPGPTEVAVSLKPSGDGTDLELEHGGFGEAEGWERAQEEARKGWEAGLENLESIFTTGADLRVTHRPMLGVMLDSFDEKIAGELGVPVTEGVRISGTIAGMGAEKAGLQANDVIVEMGETAVRGFNDLTVALQGRQAGDVVSVKVYRGAEKIQVEMALSQRPIEEFPLDPAGLAEIVRGKNAGALKALREALEGATEAEADHKPGKKEWSAREVLAHLISTEGGWQSWIGDLAADGEREGGHPENPAYLRAIAKSTPTIPALLTRLEDGMEITASFLEGATELKKRKGPLWRLGDALLSFDHAGDHVSQIKSAIAAARSGQSS